MNKNEKPSIILPLLLGVAGVAAMATAISLVKPVARDQAMDKNTVDPASLTKTKPEVLTQPLSPIVDASVNELQSSGALQPDAGAVMLILLQDGPWTIVLSSGFKTDTDGDEAVDAIASSLMADSGAEVNIVGVNNPKKSSKLARLGAKRIRDRVLKLAEINPGRVTVSFDQRSDVEGLIVEAEIKKGGR